MRYIYVIYIYIYILSKLATVLDDATPVGKFVFKITVERLSRICYVIANDITCSDARAS